MRKGEEVRVLDVDASNEDITRRVLTQIILEAKSHNNLEMLPVEFLRKLISTHRREDGDLARRLLEGGRGAARSQRARGHGAVERPTTSS